MKSFEYYNLAYFLIRSSFIGLSINNMLNIAKQDAWISALIGIIFGIFIVIFYDKLRKNNFDITKYKINYFITIFVFIYASLLTWNLFNYIIINYLSNTPVIFLAIAFAIPFIYILSKDIVLIAHSGNIFFIFSFILFCLSFFSLVGFFGSMNFLPILSNGIAKPLLGSISFIGYNVAPLFLLLIIPKEKIEDTKTKSKFFFYLIASISLFSATFLILSIYGYKLSIILQYPEFNALKRISLVGFLERLENFLSTQWIFDGFMSITLCIYYIKRTINKKITINNNLLTFIILALIYLTTFIYKNNILVRYISYIIPFISIFIFIIIPFTLKKKTN